MSDQFLCDAKVFRVDLETDEINLAEDGGASGVPLSTLYADGP